MKMKQYIGIGAIVVGVALIGFSIASKNKVLNAKEGIDQVSGFFPKNDAGSAVENKIHSKLSRYDFMIRWSMIGGIVIGVAGVYALIRFRKH